MAPSIPDLPKPPPGDNVRSFADALARRRVPTLLGDKNSLGNAYVDLPPWFRRAGINLFVVDTGFGEIRCQMPTHAEAKRMEIADKAVEDAADDAARAKATEAQYDARALFVLRLMRRIPEEWINEGEEAVEIPGVGKVEPGARVPQPTAVHKHGASAAWTYFTLLPPSTVGQVFSGFGFMALPPIQFEEVVNRTVPS